MPVDRNTCTHRHIEIDGSCSDCGTTWRERTQLRDKKALQATALGHEPATEQLIRQAFEAGYLAADVRWSDSHGCCPASDQDERDQAFTNWRTTAHCSPDSGGPA